MAEFIKKLFEKQAKIKSSIFARHHHDKPLPKSILNIDQVKIESHQTANSGFIWKEIDPATCQLY